MQGEEEVHGGGEEEVQGEEEEGEGEGEAEKEEARPEAQEDQQWALPTWEPPTRLRGM